MSEYTQTQIDYSGYRLERAKEDLRAAHLRRCRSLKETIRIEFQDES